MLEIGSTPTAVRKEAKFLCGTHGTHLELILQWHAIRESFRKAENRSRHEISRVEAATYSLHRNDKLRALSPQLRQSQNEVVHTHLQCLASLWGHLLVIRDTAGR